MDKSYVTLETAKLLKEKDLMNGVNGFMKTTVQHIVQ